MPLWFWITSLFAGLLTLLPDGVSAATNFTCTVDGNPYTLINPMSLDFNACAGIHSVDGSGNIVFNVMETTFCLIRTAMGNAMFSIYCSLVNAVAPAVRAALALYIAIFSIAVMLQIVDGKDWAMRIVKIMLIYVFTVNPTFFYDYLYNIFVIKLPDTITYHVFSVDLTGTGFQGAGAAGTVEGKRVGIIQNLDTMFNLIVGGSEIVGYMLLAIAFSIIIIGIPMFWLLLFGFLMALAAFLRVLVAYTTALVALSFTLMFAPVFIPMLMFSRTSTLFFGWLRWVIGYSMEVALILFFVFLIGGIKIMYDSGTQDALLDTSTVDPNCEIVIGDIGIAEAIRQKVPCFLGSVATVIGNLLYSALFFCITYFLTSALLFGFMGKISGTVQQLVKFSGGGAPVVTPGAEPAGGANQKLMTIEDTAKSGISTVRAGIKQGQDKFKGKQGPSVPGAKKVTEGAKDIQAGGQKIAEGSKEVAEGSKEMAEGTAKAGAGTAKAGAGAGAVVGGVVAAPFTAGASLKVSAKGGTMMAEGGAQAAEGAAQAAQGAAKTASGAVKVTQGTAQVVQGAAKIGEGAVDTATKKGDKDDKKGDERGGISGDDKGGGDDSGGPGAPSGGSPGGGGSGGGSGGASGGDSGGAGSAGGTAGGIAGTVASLASAAASTARATAKAGAAVVRKTMRALPKDSRDAQGAQQVEGKKQGRDVKVFEMDWNLDSKKEEKIKDAMEQAGFGPEKYVSYDNGNKINVVFKKPEDEKKFEAVLNAKDDDSAAEIVTRNGLPTEEGRSGKEEEDDKKPEGGRGEKDDSDEGDTKKKKDKDDEDEKT